MNDRDAATDPVPSPTSRESARAARTGARIGPADVWRMLRRVVDALPEEGMLCSALGRVMHANAAARRWLASARDARPLRDAAAEACAALEHEQAAPPVPADDVATARARRIVTLGGVEMELCAIDLGRDAHGLVPSVLVLMRTEWPAQPGRAAGVAARTSRRLHLTPAERAIARLLAARRTDGEIASALGISVRTVQSHVQHIFGKMGVHSRRAVGPALGALRYDTPLPTAVPGDATQN